jgi:hypothetical protein
VVLRQNVLAKCREANFDDAMRRVVLQRALVGWRGMRKSLVQVVTPDDLKKAFTPGGTYHRRVPRASGKGYTYYYDEEKYRNSKNAHVSGEEAAHGYISGEVEKAVTAAGSKGCDVTAFKSLVKKYGAKQVGSVLTKCSGSKFMYKGKRFYPAQKMVADEKKLTSGQKGVKSKDKGKSTKGVAK